MAEWMQTYTGKQFWPTQPRADDVDIIDIAHALSLLCRYNGHVDRFYSVAEHCVLMSQWVADSGLGAFSLEALLHDATEAYVGDMIRPLKHSMPEYRQAEDRVALAIAEKFRLPIYRPSSFVEGAGLSQGPQYVMPEVVKDADNRIILDERNALMWKKLPERWVQDYETQKLGVQITGWDPAEGERQYLEQFERLSAAVNVQDNVPKCVICGRRRTIQDAYDYSPLQVITGQRLGWYSGDDGEICPEDITMMLSKQ